MVDKQVSISNKGAALDEAVVQEFKTKLRGELIRPEDSGYDAARKVWNGMIDKHPALIVRCTGVADVISAVNFARNNKLLVAVRGGGGNFGIVTSFEYRLHPVSQVIGGLVLHPAEKAKEVL